MKTSTLVLLAVGAAVVAYIALRPSLADASTGITKPAGPRTSREALERAGINLGEKALTAGLDWLMGDKGERTSTFADSYGADEATAAARSYF